MPRKRTHNHFGLRLLNSIQDKLETDPNVSNVSAFIRQLIDARLFNGLRIRSSRELGNELECITAEKTTRIAAPAKWQRSVRRHCNGASWGSIVNSVLADHYFSRN